MSQEAIGWSRDALTLREALERSFRRRDPDARVVEVRAIASDGLVSDATYKATGYGEPLRVVTRGRDGEKRFVLHFFAANEYGHDRRSDRVASALLAAEAFGTVPGHVRVEDVGMLGPRGELVSLEGSGEPYLLTQWVEGTLYADELRAVAERGHLIERDRERLRAMLRCLHALHVPLAPNDATYRRAIRDAIGHGEGVFGIVDGYPRDVPAAPIDRLRSIEHALVDWRWRLHDRADRLSRTHGDFHPFNVLFDSKGEVALLDTSRGSVGEPADDVAAMAVNFVFFGIERRETWKAGLGVLWRDWFDGYIALRLDEEVLDAIAPFLAWRLLVVASPRWYPHLSADARDRLLRLAERALAVDRFDPGIAEELMR